MITFRPLTLADKMALDQRWSAAPWLKNYRGSEFVFASLFTWASQDYVEVACFDDFILIRSLEKIGTLYFPPVCTTKEQFARGLEMILTIDPRAKIVGVNESMLHLFPQNALVLYDDYFAEYIYRSRDLIDMAGGNYSRKRNQIKQFKRKYHWELVEFTSADEEELIAFLNIYHNEGGTDLDFSPLLYAVDHRFELNLNVDILRADGNIAGVSITTVSIFGHGVHLFEKADIAYTGSYATIVQEVSTKRFANVEFITRQEDIGIPELRKSKLSYHPIEKEAKYIISFDPLLSQLRNLYEVNFADQKKYIDFFFLHQEKDTIYIEENNQLITSCYLLDRPLMFNDQKWASKFFVAVATYEKYRNQGYMKRLLQKSLRFAFEKGVALAGLSPAKEAYYTSSGFVTYCYDAPIDVTYPLVDVDVEQSIDIEMLDALYRNSLAGKDGYYERSPQRWTEYINSLAQNENVFDLIKINNRVIGYLCHGKEEIDELILNERINPRLPIHDLQPLRVPNATNGVPSSMIRIVNVVAFLSQYQYSPLLDLAISIKCIDPLVDENNLVFSLTIKNGEGVLTPTNSYQLVATISEIADAAFNGKGALSSLFNPTNNACFDKF